MKYKLKPKQIVIICARKKREFLGNEGGGIALFIVFGLEEMGDLGACGTKAKVQKTLLASQSVI